MATRADFYVGRGKDAVWLGSVAFDGYPEGIELNSPEIDKSWPFGDRHKKEDWPKGKHLFDSKTEGEFRERLERYFLYREDVSLPENGWPWPWDNSGTTDYAYALDGGKVWASCFGGVWFDPHKECPDDNKSKKTVFPDMKSRKNVNMDMNKSGLIIIQAQSPRGGK